MTANQKKTYIKAKGNFCPFCKSVNIDSGPIKADDLVYAEVYCIDCEKQWRDIYALVDVEEVED